MPQRVGCRQVVHSNLFAHVILVTLGILYLKQGKKGHKKPRSEVFMLVQEMHGNTGRNEDRGKYVELGYFLPE